MICNWFYT